MINNNILLLAIALITYSGFAKTDPSDTLFDTSRIIEVDIQMSAADWDFIRTQVSNANEAYDQTPDLPPVSGYEYRSATVTVDGKVLENAGVRKKGGLGSMSETRPALKIKFDEYVLGQELYGRERLTLNNCIQDESFIRQPLVYGLYLKAGLPAPRCNFAHVTVNGEDMGLYANVESIKKRFLARHFTDNDGQLFEGGHADFVVGWTGHFEPKINSMDPDISRLCYMMNALDAPDDQLIDALTPLVDLEQFFKYWAMEVLSGHWDGYSSMAKNFFIYRDPATDLFNFIPWGQDQVFQVFGGNEVVYGKGKLAWRLYRIPAMQAKYVEAMEDLLTDVWNETELIAEIDRMEILIESIASSNPKFADCVKALRDFVNNRRARIKPALDNPPPISKGPWEEKCLNNYTCMDIALADEIHNKIGPKVNLIRTSSHISLVNKNAEQLNFKITAINGRVMLSGTTRQSIIKLAIAKFSRGIYLLYIEGKAFKRTVMFQNISMIR